MDLRLDDDGWPTAPYSCSLIAMHNLGLNVDKTYYDSASGMRGWDLLKSIKKQTSIRLVYGIRSKGYTVRQFTRQYPKGLFCVIAKEHAGVIDNGRLFWLSPRQRVICAHRVVTYG